MPIQVLPPHIANQIAAGEVVDRPASVVKELVENSLDAGATRIEITIERGGTKRIRIVDNGSGIAKEELSLALARHATSKIASLDDLENITSMGFRGEALASVSAVSRLTLTSRIAGQSKAWQIYVEGCDLTVKLKPAAHPVGTTVDIMDLFFNMPARRKFMRTEKTEFIHIDEVIRRLALARFNVTFILQHNGKILRQYHAVSQHSQHLRRLGKICGLTFVERSIGISWQHGDLAIHGWVADPADSGELPDIQYSYINLRTMSDQLIKHAIRHAYQAYLTGTQLPAFVLFINVDPRQVDINVHPTKNEVRFHQARLVHDFIYQAVVTALQQSKKAPDIKNFLKKRAGSCLLENSPASGRNYFSLPVGKTFSMWEEQQADSTDRHNGDAEYLYKNETISTQQTTLLDGKIAQGNILAQQLADCYNVPHDGAALSSFAVEAIVSSGPVVAGNPYSFGKVLTLVTPCYAITESANSFTLISLSVAERYLIEHQLTPSTEQLRAQPLLIPLRMTLGDKEVEALKRYNILLQQMGIIILGRHYQVILSAVPLPLRQQTLQKLIPALLCYLHNETSVTPHQVAVWLARKLQCNLDVWSYARAIQLLVTIERLCPQWVTTPPDGLLVTLNFDNAIKALNHE